MTACPTVVIADDHPLVCNGLKSIVEPSFSVVAMVHDGHDVVGTVVRYRPTSCSWTCRSRATTA
jgi:DNA-binding NarL/FixJ family response regulator